MEMADLRSFTLQEQLLIIEDAEKLIATPDTWVQGEWECPLYETDALGWVKRDPKTKEPIPRCDKKGNPLFGYCIEGAVNRAILDRFGEARAKAVGVFGTDDPEGRRPVGSQPTELLSLNTVAAENFGNWMLAQDVNDRDIHQELEDEGVYEGRITAEKYNRLYAKKRISYHADVLSILREKKREIRRRLKRASS